MKYAFALIIISILAMGCVQQPGPNIPMPNSNQAQNPMGRQTHATVQPLDFLKLQSFLPPATGDWTRHDPSGQNYNFDKQSWSDTGAEYFDTNGNYNYATFIDTGYDQTVSYFVAWNLMAESQNSDGYVKKTQVQGYPAYEKYSKSAYEGEPDEYGLTILVKDRFFVWLRGNDKALIDAQAQWIDISGLAALA